MILTKFSRVRNILRAGEYEGEVEWWASHGVPRCATRNSIYGVVPLAAPLRVRYLRRRPLQMVITFPKSGTQLPSALGAELK